MPVHGRAVAILKARLGGLAMGAMPEEALAAPARRCSMMYLMDDC